MFFVLEGLCTRGFLLCGSRCSGSGFLWVLSMRDGRGGIGSGTGVRSTRRWGCRRLSAGRVRRTICGPGPVMVVDGSRRGAEEPRGELPPHQRDSRMSDADKGQRLGAILARLRAVAASTSAQSGRHPAGELTASAAQLDTQSVSHAVAGRVQALAQYSRQPANRPEGLAGTVQPPVALEVAARVAALQSATSTSGCDEPLMNRCASKGK
eukprot:scaffold15229_cov163-Isochrysis_galbana.AAC.4